METIKEKYENIILENLPEHLKYEINVIKEETDNFESEEALEIWEKNFNYLYFVVESKHPVALRSYVPPPEPEPVVEEVKPQEPTPEEIEKIRKKKELAEKYLKKTAKA